MDLTCKKQVVKWQTSPVSAFKLWHCGFWTFFGTSRSFLGFEGWTSCLGLESLGKWNVSVSSRSWRLTISVSSQSCDLTSCGHACFLLPWSCPSNLAKVFGRVLLVPPVGENNNQTRCLEFEIRQNTSLWASSANAFLVYLKPSACVWWQQMWSYFC